MVRLPATLLLLTGPRFTIPETVKTDPLKNEIVPVPVLITEPPNWRLRHAAVGTSTVTVKPPLIITSSPASGTEPPQVAGALQLPDCELIFVMALASSPVSKIIIMAINAIVVFFFIKYIRIDLTLVDVMVDKEIIAG
jgi:hypothetical protein